MECKAFEFNTLKDYKYADIFARYNGKWIFCKHKERTTWENPGGHIEAGETPLKAAERELFEETGAITFDLEPLCDYQISGVLNGVQIEGNGQVYFAKIYALGNLPESEMEKICLLDSLPDKLTYPEYTSEIFPLALQQSSAFVEQLSIPGAGGLIVKKINDVEHILLQARYNPNTPTENGLLEIPAGRIRAFENIYDTIKREIKEEIKEETGLDVIEILGENMQSIYKQNNYKVINFMPFSCSQNIEGDYPVMVLIFICRVTGVLLPFSNESKNYKWTAITEIKKMLEESPQSLYPMHVDTLKKYIRDCE